MNTRTRTLVAVSAAAVFGSVGVVANALSDRTDPQVAQVGQPLTLEVDVPLDSYVDATRLPILPDRPIVEISAGDVIVLGRQGGLESVSATLNGAELKLRTVDDAFVLTVGDIVGSGSATLLLTERFDDGEELTLPYTVYVGARTSAIVNSDKSGRPAATWSISIPFGDDKSQLGFIAGNEGEAIGPSAIVAQPDGRVAVLDTAKQRVVLVGPKGDVTTLAALPSRAYTSFATNESQSTVLAVDQVRAEAVNIATGESLKLPSPVARLPHGIDFAVADSGTFFATNPGDGVMYSVGDTTGDAALGNTERLVGRERVTVRDGVMLVQATAVGNPVSLDFPESAWVDVLDHVKLADGRVVVLVGSMVGATPTIEMYVFDEALTTSIEVPVGFGYMISNYLTVVDGSTVVVASPTGDGLDLFAYQL
jgi:hypothetical protein